MEALLYMAQMFSNPELIALVAIGTFSGIYIGVIPGLSGTMAISLLVSFTFGWSTNTALALMIGVYVGVVYGGSRTAILLNIPGAPAAIATGFDGYPLAKKGMAGEAMGISATQSVIGTLLGTFVLMTLAPAISKIALTFRSVDYLILAFMGLMMVGSLGSKSLKRGIVAGAIGLVIGCIGIDPQTSVKRFTFDVVYLNAGVDFVVAMIGLFGASEALIQLSDINSTAIKQKINKIIPSWKVTLKYLPLTIRSAIIGVLVGALPGAGGDVAALLSYDNAKRSVKNPEVPFGEGAIEGVVAPETAHNAAIGGDLIPMLTLGIPGDAITAILISALVVHGIIPGPNLITQSPDLFHLIICCLLFASFFLLIFGLSGIRIFAKLVEIPKQILMPIILMLSVIGSFAIRNSVLDIFWMFAFGGIGYLFKKFEYPVAPIVLGIILCGLFENNFRRGIMLEGSLLGMFTSIFVSPVSIVLFGLVLFLIIVQTGWFKNFRSKGSN